MTEFLVEREFKSITMDQLAAAQRAAIDKAAEMRKAGKDIAYVRSTYVPGDGRCMCLFRASDEADVRELNKEAGIPYKTVTTVLDLTP